MSTSSNIYCRHVSVLDARLISFMRNLKGSANSSRLIAVDFYTAFIAVASGTSLNVRFEIKPWYLQRSREFQLS
ncbi:hypothetical protein QWZ16_22930 [Vibrio ostreicida]|uniref:Uncharacterized protein n=1 Tax=Vibrio ostreicida TaxID=526588 RepID=A0ABT8C292_9VIBR|nr:hypothetical protein [Vibrio ostreicida]MDN3612458.1 hypothetical protein [Vibrio ostreicida]